MKETLSAACLAYKSAENSAIFLKKNVKNISKFKGMLRPPKNKNYIIL